MKSLKLLVDGSVSVLFAALASFEALNFVYGVALLLKSDLFIESYVPSLLIALIGAAALAAFLILHRRTFLAAALLGIAVLGLHIAYFLTVLWTPGCECGLPFAERISGGALVGLFAGGVALVAASICLHLKVKRVK